MAEKTMAEILATAKKVKASIDSPQSLSKEKTFDFRHLTLEQKLKLRQAANNPKDPNYKIWLQLNQEKQASNWIKIDKKKIKDLTEDDNN
ncbi:MULTISPECIES: hypothetical protein [Spiroplasma]|uniref:Uncharacterized protein n=2 Tax=Spiroplasma melliferum TaxID=2134 RepID=A0AAI9T3D4_SPIME|nr:MULTISPECIES: hypothetical protein [Spiroplasma]ELL44870.1 hypothetical protein SMIPMB4A_v3c1990 [Spiroplasma melliferum IPMB4A]KAI92727.1 hypothetical protein SPM_001470 [Spiroplasma melliferum KC3]PQP78038.1 hypothetical protein C6B38_08600 [Spiroplasma sp. ChiS]QCO24340.1 hypothetical protein SRED_002834 [Spiroplasma melliferum]